MSKRVFDEFKAALPFAPELANGWIKLVAQTFPDVPDKIYGCDVVTRHFRADSQGSRRNLKRYVATSDCG